MNLLLINFPGAKVNWEIDSKDDFITSYELV